MTHPDDVENYPGSLDDLAKEVGNMRYDRVVEFLRGLADDLQRQGDNDHAHGRTKLASKLYTSANKLYNTAEEMEKAWKICEPYMKDDNQ